jgi:guanylate kinase
MNTMVLVLGASGSGKDYLVDMACKQYDLKKVVSYTTRPKRDNEKPNAHIFVTDEEFDKLTNIVAYTEFNGYRYCATQQQIDDADFYIIDPRGLEDFKNNYKGDKLINSVLIDCPAVERFLRMKKRYKDSKTGTVKAMERIINDRKEFKDIEEKVDYVISNRTEEDAQNCMFFLKAMPEATE